MRSPILQQPPTNSAGIRFRFERSLGDGRLTSATQVFVKNGDKIGFAQFSEEFGGGFVADGNDVRSKTARCTITSRKETGDTIDFQAACASEIMATSVNLRLKILDANSVSRIFTDPAMAGMELTFYRCSM